MNKKYIPKTIYVVPNFGKDNDISISLAYIANIKNA